MKVLNRCQSLVHQRNKSGPRPAFMLAEFCEYFFQKLLDMVYNKLKTIIGGVINAQGWNICFTTGLGIGQGHL